MIFNLHLQVLWQVIFFITSLLLLQASQVYHKTVFYIAF